MPSVEQEIVLTIYDKPNNLPYFDPKLPTSATIVMTAEPEPWSMKLPAIKDTDFFDKLTLTCNMGYAANFVSLEESKDYISILDISKGGATPIRAGMFFLTF